MEKLVSYFNISELQVEGACLYKIWGNFDSLVYFRVAGIILTSPVPLIYIKKQTQNRVKGGGSECLFEVGLIFEGTLI